MTSASKGNKVKNMENNTASKTRVPVITEYYGTLGKGFISKNDAKLPWNTLSKVWVSDNADGSNGNFWPRCALTVVNLIDSRFI